MTYYTDQLKKAARKFPELYQNELDNIKTSKTGKEDYKKPPLTMYFKKFNK